MAPVEEFRIKLRAALAGWEIHEGKDTIFERKLRLTPERVDSLTETLMPVLEEVARAAFNAGKK